MKKRYRIRKFSPLWFAIAVAIAVAVIAMMGLAFIPEEEEEPQLPQAEELTAEDAAAELPEEPDEVYFPLTDLQRDLVERVVAAEGRGECIEAQMAIAQTIRDRAITRGQTVDEVCSAPNQFAIPYMGDISEKTKDAVRFVFDDGDSVFEENVTHFYAWQLIDPPYWTESFTFLGEIGGTRFYGEKVK